MRPHEIWRHRLGTPVTDDVLVATEPDVRFNLDVAPTRSERWIVITREQPHVVGGVADPRRRPDRRRRCSCGPGPTTSSTAIDHWGDRFVVLTNLDAPDFRVMTAPLDAPGDWTELLPHVPGRRFTPARAVRRPPRAARVERRPAEGAGPVRATARERRARLRRRAARPRARRQPGVDDDVAARRLHVADDAGVGLRRRRRDRRARRCASRRRRRTSTSTATSRCARGRRRPTARASRSTSCATSTRRSTAPRRRVVYGYGSYEASIPPYFSAARLSLLDRGVRVGARPPARRRRARPRAGGSTAG